MESIKETLFTTYNYLLNDVYIIDFLNKYQYTLISIVVTIVAFYFGKWRARSNQFERYINSFINSTKTEAELKSKQEFYLKIKLYKRYTTGCIVLVATIYLLYTNYYILFDKMLNIIEKYNQIRQVNMNIILILVTVVTMLISYFISRFINYAQININNRLEGIKTNKSLYVEKFFDLIGPEMMREIRKFLIRGTEKEEAKYRELESKYYQMQDKFKRIQEKCLKETKKFMIYKHFADDIIKFEWCEACYSVDKSGFQNYTDEKLKFLTNIKKIKENEESAKLQNDNEELNKNKEDKNSKKLDNNDLIVDEGEVNSQFGVKQATNLHAESDCKGIEDVFSHLSKSYDDMRGVNKCTSLCLERFLYLCENIGIRLDNDLKTLNIN